MKLVEILAHEMDKWPSRVVAITQDGVGFVTGSSGLIEKTIMTSGVLSDDWSTAIVTREMWEAEREKVEGKVEWNGEGLPPVHTVCEHQGDDDDCNSWFPVLILAHAKIGDRYVAVFQRVDDDMHITFSDAVFFRPICTPEQIAAQEREEAVQQMLSVAEDMEAGLYMICEALYDAGYRKQEKD